MADIDKRQKQKNSYENVSHLFPKAKIFLCLHVCVCVCVLTENNNFVKTKKKLTLAYSIWNFFFHLSIPLYINRFLSFFPPFNTYYLEYLSLQHFIIFGINIELFHRQNRISTFFPVCFKIHFIKLINCFSKRNHLCPINTYTHTHKQIIIFQ